MADVTVLVSTSPIPSHPSTAILDETLGSVRERLPHAPIIVMADGDPVLRRKYDQYLRRLVHHDPDVLLVIYPGYVHQAEMTRCGLDLVRTEHVLFVEHDTPLVGYIPFGALCDAIHDHRANLIRLHHEASILEPHRYLMIDDEPQGDPPLLRTRQWSNRPHLVDTQCYRAWMAAFVKPGARIFTEEVMHSVAQERDLRLAIYAPPGDMKRSTHLDGRRAG